MTSESSTPPREQNTLRQKFGAEVKILQAVDVYDDARVLVIGDPENGVYEWAIERKGKVEEHSDLSYGNTVGALRDGLIAYWPQAQTPQFPPEHLRMHSEVVDRVLKLANKKHKDFTADDIKILMGFCVLHASFERVIEKRTAPTGSQT